MKVLLVSLSILLMSFNLGGSVEGMMRDEYPIFLGVIENIKKEDGNKGYKILVDGYIKGGVIQKEKIVAIVSADTDIKMIGQEDECAKSFRKGDNVFIEFSKAMTFSIPPQSFARKLEIYRRPYINNMESRNNNY